MSNSQMLKGIIDGCILKLIDEKEIYGYELAEKLGEYGFEDFSEGTIYPILLRMQKEQLVTTTLKKSTAGPKRKYYTLNAKGREELHKFEEEWKALQNSVNQILSRNL